MLRDFALINYILYYATPDIFHRRLTPDIHSSCSAMGRRSVPTALLKDWHFVPWPEAVSQELMHEGFLTLMPGTAVAIFLCSVDDGDLVYSKKPVVLGVGRAFALSARQPQPLLLRPRILLKR